MFRLMLDVGLRVGEVAALWMDDLIITDDGSVGRLRVQGKGDKERFVWLLPETLSIVQAWLGQRPAVSDEALFITRLKKGFSVRGIEERLAHYCRQAGVKVSPHQLRHTFGRRMAEAEMSVTSLAALMGHAQVTTTQVYINGAGVRVQADYRAAIARLSAARPEDASAPDDGQGSALTVTEMADVWTLAGVEPTSPTSPQPAAEVDMDLNRYWEGLPEWLTGPLQEYIAYRQRRWKPSRVRKYTSTKLSALRRVWRWLLDEEQISSIADLQRAHVQSFIEARLATDICSGTVNAELTDLWVFLSYLEERGHPVNPSVFRLKRPKRGDPVPRFLSETDFRQLENTLLQATKSGSRDDLLDRAWFYLLSEAGLRISEVCDLRLGDIDLAAQRLLVRQGKGNRDRNVPLSPALLVALKAYLPVRGKAQTDYLLIYRQQAVIKPSLIRSRLHRYGQQAQVEVSPHRLRHTLATRLLNEGMSITSLQRLLGHERLDTTLIYARVYDETVRQDYERAQARLSSSPLADELFNAPTKTVEPQISIVEGDCV
jgi:site-specific recombinase XerD